MSPLILEFVRHGTALAVACVPQAQTQDPVPAAAPQAGETIVTARKRPESAQNVPGSVTSISGEELDAAGITNIRDASLRVPNMLITEFTSRRLSLPYVRGIGSGQGEPAVTTYVDGVPQLTTGSTNLPLSGIERVEFLRGPQGTLYGRNAIGGVIHLISKRPTDEPEISAGVTVGDFNLQEYGLGWSGPLAEGRTWLDLSGQFSSRDGYTENDATGNSVDDREAFFGRASVLFAPDDSNEVRVGVYGERARDGGFALNDLSTLRNRPHHIDQDFEGVVERDLISPSVTWNHYGDSLDLTTITSYQDWDVLETSDFDFTTFDAVRRETTEAQEYFYQEVRVASPDDAPIELTDRADMKWIAGVSLFQADSDRSVQNDFRPGGAGIFFPPANVGVDRNRGTFDDFGYGVFGQATVTIDDTVDLTAGLRFDMEDKEADLRHTFVVGGFTALDVERDFDDDYDEVVPHFSAAWRPREDITTYASASKGFKAGGFNLNAPTGSFSFDTETSWTYELGVKKAFHDDKVHVSAAVFHIDWEDQQLSLFDPAIGGYVDNAGESKSQGLEVEADARVAEGLTLFAGLGLLDTEIEEYTDTFGADTSGNDLPFAPETTWSAGVQYEDDLPWSPGGARDAARWYARAEYVAVGDFAYDAGNIEEESYDLTHLRLGVKKGPLSVDLWVRNAFDEEYFPVAFQANPIDPTQFIAESGAPRTWGVTLRGSF